MTSSAPARYTFQEYLELEASSEEHYEFFDGAVYAMSGGSPEHSGLAANVISILSAQLAGKPCRVFTSDLRVRVLETGLATHPDVSVICGTLQRDPQDTKTATNPVLVLEVLSPTTQRYDREEKAAHYRRIPSLQQYVLISQEEQRIDVFTRNEDNSWTLRETRSGNADLGVIGCKLSVEDVYRDPLATQPTN
ncbi:MAG TPA: Uma2 family endonuclease [Polyangiaceae bacterium]|nr:Uma2 family endonuclease [Polyangiaceae bacterium]